MNDRTSHPAQAAVRSPLASAVPQQQRAGILDPLDGRVLLHVSPWNVGNVLNRLDAGRSGLVLCGKNAVRTAGRLRRDGYAGPLLVDPAVYGSGFATEDAPFLEAEDGTLSFDDPLGKALFEQSGAGASAILTPTGYIRAEDSDALKAAARQVNALDDPRMIFTVPADVAWLQDDSLRQLITVLQQVRGPKALVLGGQKDPLGRFTKAVANLSRVLQEVPQTGLLRTDLAAFGALAHGAAFSAFGYSSTLRHAVPPDQVAESSPPPVASPHVIFPELMRYFLGSTLAKKYAASAAPACWCPACGGRGLDAYPDKKNPHIAQAAEHNVAILMRWLQEMDAVKPGPARAAWWQRRCQEALAHYPIINAAIDQPNAFKPDAQLKRWADLDLLPPH